MKKRQKVAKKLLKRGLITLEDYFLLSVPKKERKYFKNFRIISG